MVFILSIQLKSVESYIVSTYFLKIYFKLSFKLSLRTGKRGI